MTEQRVNPEHEIDVRIPGPIRLFLAMLSGLTLLCASIEAGCRWILHRQYPYTWPLMQPGNPFWDFSLYRPRFNFFHSPQFFTFDGPGYFYPAPLATLHWLLYQLPSSTCSFLRLLVTAWIAAALLFGRLLLHRGVALRNVLVMVSIAAVCSYPFFFEFEQANLEWILCVLIGGGIVATLRGRGYTAATCFGIAGSMKYYPLILVGLLITRRQYKEASAAVAVCGVSTLLGLWIVCPNLATSWHGTQSGLAAFHTSYVLGYEQVGFDHSLIGVLKSFSSVTLPEELAPETLSTIVRFYMPLAAFVGIILYICRIRKLPIINQVICLTVAAIVLPPVSYDYTLLHLYVPWALLVMVAIESRGRNVPGLTAAMVCCAIVFAPVTELIVHGQSYGGEVKACALTVLGLIALLRKFPSSFDAVTIVQR